MKNSLRIEGCRVIVRLGETPRGLVSDLEDGLACGAGLGPQFLETDSLIGVELDEATLVVASGGRADRIALRAALKSGGIDFELIERRQSRPDRDLTAVAVLEYQTRGVWNLSAPDGFNPARLRAGLTWVRFGGDEILVVTGVRYAGRDVALGVPSVRRGAGGWDHVLTLEHEDLVAYDSRPPVTCRRPALAA